jgi:hypothetical protein
LTGAALRVPNPVCEKIPAKIFAAAKKIYATMPHVEFKILFHHVNRAQHNWRIPKYTNSSVSQQVKQLY